MRIRSITARNYKIHREISVELDPACTVIGGPNESGKSTLAEAAHRAFFLKAKITGDTQKQMVSFTPSGQPEVEVTFEVGTKIYRIFKRFSGQTGIARLSQVGGPNWQDEAAEEHLAKILGVESAAGGRGAGDRAAQQWAHLWVWQGEAAHDPAAHANTQRDTLLSRLQTAGGAALMQSELDARIARRCAEQFESIYNRNGSPKVNSDLAKAIQREVAASAEQTKARETLDRLQQAISDHEQAESTMAAAEHTLRLLVPQKEEVERKLKSAQELQRDEEGQRFETETTARKHTDLVKADQRIHTLRQEIQNRKCELEPQIAQANKSREVADEKRRTAQTASHNYDTATDATRTARLQAELAAAYEVFHETTAHYKQLAEKADSIAKEQKTRFELETELAKLPPVDAAKLKKLQKLEMDRSNADSALNAMAARVEVITSTAPIQAGNTPLALGQDHIVSDDTDLTIGSTTRLRIKPGGGTSLADARQQVSRARAKLQDALDKLGLTTLDAAANALAHCERIRGQIRDAEIRLATLKADSIHNELSAAQLDLNNAQGEVDRRKAQLPAFVPPAQLAEAKELSSSLANALTEKEAHERILKVIRDESAQAWAEADADAQARFTHVDKENREIDSLAIELTVLTRTHGEDGERSRELARLTQEKEILLKRLSTTRAALDNLQPDLLSTDKTRLERAINQAVQDKVDAGKKLAVAKHTLSSDGTADPAASLATAEAQLKAAQDNLIQEQRRARAAQLLHHLFLDEQRKLAEQLTRPLVEKVSGYLQCLFGIHTQASISLEENQFFGLQITRPEREISGCQFDQLSGGTKEQVAAAFRLAMAEILAESHHGSLPVVFDDAFSYSDPERVQTLQRMLDLAASRGLQILVLTCNPVDYAALGAQQIKLTSLTLGSESTTRSAKCQAGSL